MAIAKTGSGKTLGFLMPGFVVLKRNRNNSKMGPTVLILSPTRELATQIQDEAVKFGKSSRISCVVCLMIVATFLSLIFLVCMIMMSATKKFQCS